MDNCFMVVVLVKDDIMKTIQETYRIRLEQLINECGSQARLSKLTGIAPSQLSQWLNASKISGTNKRRAMSVRTARRLEQATGKPVGWFDQPFNSKTIIQTNVNYPHAIHSTIPVIPVLEIDQAKDFVSEPQSVNLGNCEKVATVVSHSELAFAVRMTDHSMCASENTEETIYKNDILIAEPKIRPRHEDIVVVHIEPLNGSKIGLIAKLEIDPFGTLRLRRTGINIAGDNPMLMPDNAYICGVVIEIKRRIISPEVAKNRIDPHYNPLKPSSS